jgi:hypothetical protein
MLPATAAELLLLQPLSHRFAVLGRRIVPLFAITALHRNNFSGHCSLLIQLQNEEFRMQNSISSVHPVFTSSF